MRSGSYIHDSSLTSGTPDSNTGFEHGKYIPQGLLTGVGVEKLDQPRNLQDPHAKRSICVVHGKANKKAGAFAPASHTFAPIYFFFIAGFFFMIAFGATAFSRPPISVSESAALNGNWRTDSCPVVLRVTSTRRLLARMIVLSFLRILAFSPGVSSGF